MKTFKQIREFNMAATSFLQKAPQNGQTKLGYAIVKLSQGAVQTITRKYQEAYRDAFYDKVTRIQIDLALTDKETGAVLSAPKDADRPYLYNKEGLKGVMKAENAFQSYWNDEALKEWDVKEFEVVPHLVEDVPATLTDADLEAFDGFVLDAVAAKKVIEEKVAAAAAAALSAKAEVNA